MKKFVCLGALAALTLINVAPMFAQAAAAAADAPPPMLFIYREMVRAGKVPAHDANERAWAAAHAKAKVPVNFLAMTTVVGPAEAWYLSPVASWGGWQKQQDETSAIAGWNDSNAKFQAADADLISNSVGIMARYRPALSYRAKGNLSGYRYVMVDIYRIKPGHEAEFAEGWRMQVEAHTKANMDESWAIYQVDSGMPQGTFMYLQAIKSFDEVDKSGEMHGADAFRDAVGEGGRAKMREMTRSAIDSSMRLYFALDPNQSVVPQSWIDADAKFWTPKPLPPAVPAAKKPGNQ